MKKLETEEKVTQQKKEKNPLLQTYFASLISLVLCVTMFLGTSYAWFTGEVENAGNQIYIGSLEADLLLNGVSLKDNATKIYADTIRWEPGYTALRTLTVENTGDLSFAYELMLTSGQITLPTTAATDPAATPDPAAAAAALEAVAKHFVVYVHAGDYAEGEEKPKNFAEILESDAWAPVMYEDAVATLADLLDPEKDIAVFDGVIPADREEKSDTYIVALHMNETATADVMGHRIALSVKLVAYQQGYEKDDFGSDYDSGAKGTVPVTTEAELRAALEAGQTPYIAEPFTLSNTVEITKDTRIVGGGYALSRAEGFTGTMFNVQADATLTLEGVVLEGGGVWGNEETVEETEETEETEEETEPAGITATGSLITTVDNGSIVLEKGTVLQNNDGVSAVTLATRGGGSLTVNGASILHNRATGGGAIWGGGNITINEGSKINGNHATEIGGAVRMVGGAGTFTMNGGEMNGNTCDGAGGAIYSVRTAGYATNTFVLNGGEMAENSAATAGGAAWTGNYESWTISGDFVLRGNAAKELGGAIRFSEHASLTMTGGKVYGNTCTDSPATAAFFLNNNSATFTGGEISDSIRFSGGLGFTVGNATYKDNGVVVFKLSTNHNTVYLAEEFSQFSFSTETLDAFNFKPAEGYTYTAGDEAKLICLNDGYTTVWDAASGTFVLQAD